MVVTLRKESNNQFTTLMFKGVTRLSLALDVEIVRVEGVDVEQVTA